MCEFFLWKKTLSFFVFQLKTFICLILSKSSSLKIICLHPTTYPWKNRKRKKSGKGGAAKMRLSGKSGSLLFGVQQKIGKTILGCIEDVVGVGMATCSAVVGLFRSDAATIGERGCWQRERRGAAEHAQGQGFCVGVVRLVRGLFAPAGLRAAGSAAEAQRDAAVVAPLCHSTR